MATTIPFQRELEFNYGQSSELSPIIRRIIAENPSSFTFHGTGTYILGRGNVAIIDPGPMIDGHIDALMKAIEGETVTHLLITHTHMDHSPAAAIIKEKTGAKTYGFGPHGSGNPEVEREEGGDMDFVPDVAIKDGDVIQGDGWSCEAIYTPGHLSNHICFSLREEKALFTGDHVMGWSTTVVSPPDGDMSAYMNSLEKLLDRDDEIYWPTHGPAITDTKPFVEALISHRHDRMDQARTCLDTGPKTISEMVAVMYADVPKHLHPAAARSLFSHLIHMVNTGEVDAGEEATETSLYRLI